MTRTNRKRKISTSVLALLLASAMLFGMVPAFALPVSAQDPVPAPTNLRWDGYTLRWDGIPGEAQYAVYVKKGGGLFDNGRILGNTYYDFSGIFYEGGMDVYFIEISSLVNSVRSVRVSAPDFSYPPKPTNFRWDGYTLRWDAVPLATDYFLTMWKDGELFSGLPSTFNTYFDFEQTFAEHGSGEYSIHVNTHIGAAFSTLAPAPDFSYPPAPTNARWDGYVLRWDAVPGATEYTLGKRKDGKVFEGISTTINNYYDFSETFAENGKGEYSVNIYSRIGDANSNSAPAPNFSYPPAPTNVRWDGYVLRWDAVPGATEYALGKRKDGRVFEGISTTISNYYDFSEMFAEFNGGVYSINIYARIGDANSNPASAPDIEIAHTHKWENTYTSDESGHWYACKGCSEKKDFAAHNITEHLHDETQHWGKCSVCGGFGARTDHTGGEWQSDETDHWKDCTVAGCGTIAATKAAHTFSSDCDRFCDICNYERTDTVPHDYRMSTNSSEHWLECPDCHEEKAESREAHRGGYATVTSKAICEVCNTEYGESASNVASGICGDPEVHSGEDVQWTLDSAGTLTISGTGDIASYSSGNYNPAPWRDHETSIKRVVIESGVTGIGKYALASLSSMTDITLPDTLISIGEYAFDHCSVMESVTLPDSVTTVGEYAFNYCKKLREITLPAAVTSISRGLFKNCESLASFTIPSTVTFVSNEAFYGCSSLTELVIPESISEISNSMFERCTSLRSVTIPNTVTKVGNSAFRYCASLRRIKLPDSITEMGSYVFQGCAELKFANIPSQLTYVPTGMFYDCSKLIDVPIPSNVTVIESSAFMDCTSLTSVTFPEGVTEIMGYAFAGCIALKAVVLPTTMTKIDSSAFYNIKTNTWIYYNGTKEQFDAMLAPATIDAQNFVTAYTYSQNAGRKIPPTSGNLGVMGSETDVKWVLDGGTLTVTGSGRTASWVTAPWYALKNSINKIVVGEGITHLGGGFDDHYHLTEISLPDSLAFCPDGLVSDCCELTDITLPDGIPNVGIAAFDRCDVLKSVTLPQTVTEIKNYAFRGCNELTDIYFVGTEEEWNGVKVGTNNEPLANATVHYGAIPTPAEYDITVTDGTAYVGEGVSVTRAAADTVITVIANTAPTGQEFDKWEVVSGGVTLENASSEVTTFTMPANAVSIKATYKAHVHTGGTATCTAQAVCDVCGQPYGEPASHDFSVLDHDGTHHWHKCSRCDATDTKENHTEVIDEALSPTCKAEGHTEGKHCSVCGEILVPTEVIPVTEHKWDGGTVTTPSTGKVHGEKTFCCEICGDTRIEELPFASDVNGDGKINTSDVVLYLRYIAGWGGLKFDPEVADVNGDGKNNTSDAVLMLRYIAGWDVTLGGK